MNHKTLLAFAATVLLLCSLSVLSVKAQKETSVFIFIRADGNIEPSSAPLQLSNDVYTFTGNIHNPMIIERNNILLDGGGLLLDGVGHNGTVMGRDSQVGINVTASNVTIRNIRILHWDAGILGAYDGNSIRENLITNNDYGIKVYGNDYNISRNYIANNICDGVQLRANHTIISQNNLTDNNNGVELTWYNHIITENNLSNQYDIVGLGWCLTVCRNNFFTTNPNHYVFAPFSSGDATFDNGREGNYWGSYKGVDANGDGIGDEPYTIESAYTYTPIVGKPASGSTVYGVDTRPLMKPVIIQEPSPSPKQTSPPPTPSPTPTTSSTPKSSLAPTSIPQQLTPIPEQSTVSSVPTEIVLGVMAIAVIVIVTVVLAKRENSRFRG
jgi:nitrous oxidase accessory protein NosD